MANEERLLGHELNAIASIDGVVGFMESMKKTGGDSEEKKIGINDDGYVMNQSGEKKPIEYEAVLMVPKNDVATFQGKYRNDAILNTFRSGLDDPVELAKAGEMQIKTADWDAPILENNVVKVTLKMRTRGYGSTTTYGTIIGVVAQGGGGGS